MLVEIKTAVKYQETFVPGQREAIVVLNNLLEAGIFSEYFLYEGKDEVRIAGGQLAKVVVTPDQVLLESPERSAAEPISDPFKQVEALLNSLSIGDWTAYGYTAFELAHFYSSYSKVGQQPLCHFLVPETELHFTKQGVKIKTTKSLDLVRRQLFVDNPLPNYEAATFDLDGKDRAKYENSVSTLIDSIKNANLHKAIISRSFNFPGDLNTLGTYVLSAKANNSARSYCFNLGDIRAVGFSPETLMEVNRKGFVTTNPLAGTRPRGVNIEEDIRFNNELFTDAKEVKEHSLSVWLAQDEIAAVCVPETVQILNFMEVKQYRCVQHLSSRVGGQLKVGNTLWDAFKVLFPGITVSGISKDKALKWIDHLEEEPRGIYAGGIGWLNSHGEADIAIAIRSVYQYGNRIQLNAGAGIVAESIPENEYIESVNKMNTMLNNLVLRK
ncbi:MULTISPECIES: chorismate-binding protein [unclassified Nodularia (in: cyanobacteria)]|uniref:anthranilate synthase component I family protein n=1 Tax=unclassified Nodularia (in: cyanobacteria) TaxID=2656917 RepID=UPI00187F83F9|nr:MULTISPECIES: chorismate-binding protein [unclassified Nodularia (in: cyanobacteria)]MBE9201700.1 chorismate-binding protein [Nodularia sp. LEGE 06071]MCC2691271.1 chorismate-binding protein [Nodularia sp. LEGE 04288]